MKSTSRFRASSRPPAVCAAAVAYAATITARRANSLRLPYVAVVRNAITPQLGLCERPQDNSIRPAAD